MTCSDGGMMTSSDGGMMTSRGKKIPKHENVRG